MASSNANSTVLPAFISSQVLLPIHLNPVSVSYTRDHADNILSINQSTDQSICFFLRKHNITHTNKAAKFTSITSEIKDSISSKDS